MSRGRWVGSLYWRIALACLGLLASGLIVQLGVVLFTLSRPSGLHARATAQRLAETVARDLAETLDADPAADVRDVLARHADSGPWPAFFVTTEGRVTGPMRGRPPEMLVRRLAELGSQPDESFDRPIGIARVEVLGTLEGRIVVLPRRPGWAVIGELGPAVLGGAVLAAIGVAALLAWVAFGPAHRRLRALESAATRLGAGDLTARAPEGGHDEIGRVARAFNQTADALAAQIRRVTSEQEVRRQLLADVSHELHTPLTAIRGYVETLRMPELQIPEADRARYLAVVDDEAIRLEQLIGDLLDLAKMEAGGQGVRKQTIALSAVWARLRDRHAPSAAAAGVTLIVEDSSLDVDADAVRLEQALSNLVANAIEFTPASGTVRVAAVALPHATRIDVVDSGIGLTPEEQTRVFDRFYKQDGSRSRGGSGLGLSIVRAIATAHGGTVTVRSTPGQGSTFSVSLPTTAPDVAAS